VPPQDRLIVPGLGLGLGLWLGMGLGRRLGVRVGRFRRCAGPRLPARREALLLESQAVDAGGAPAVYQGTTPAARSTATRATAAAACPPTRCATWCPSTSSSSLLPLPTPLPKAHQRHAAGETPPPTAAPLAFLKAPLDRAPVHGTQCSATVPGAARWGARGKPRQAHGLY